MNAIPSCAACRNQNGLITLAGADSARAELCSCLSPCPRCKGAGEALEVDADGYKVWRRCPLCSSARKNLRFFNEANLPPRYHGAQVNNYRNLGGNQGELKDMMRHYVMGFKKEPRGILLIGKPGVGKTHLLCALVRVFTLRDGIPCRFIEFTRLLSRIKAGYSAGRSEEQIIGQLARVPVLAIDDMGKGVGSDWEMTILDALISRRYDARRPVLVTTNYELREPLNAGQSARGTGFASSAEPRPLTAGRTSRERNRAQRSRINESLEDRVGARVASRLGEMCDVRDIKGPDYRQMNFKG